jgi:hypothetical protein
MEADGAYVPPYSKKKLKQFKDFAALCPDGEAAAILAVCLMPIWLINDPISAEKPWLTKRSMQANRRSLVRQHLLGQRQNVWAAFLAD